ncbi:hypothetical protein HYU16_00935 [Candidatus Woesearchaeota archaeon]|nr:hypothetical protein [Candidatus Woesearchaeota archaeon]
METWRQRFKRLRETYFGNVWDILTWLSLAGIFLWGIAKAAGWINTPLIIELAPVLLAAFSFGRFFQEQKEFKNEMHQFKNETCKELTGLSVRLFHMESMKLKRAP